VIVRVGCAPREASLSFEDFQEHWASEHGALAGTIPGLRSYVQNHAVLANGQPLLPYVGFDACSELEFESLEAMDAGFGSEHYRTNVVADEKVLVDKTRFGMLLTERRVLSGGDPGGDAVKLLTFLTDDRETHAPGAVKHEQLVVIPGAHDGRIEQPFADVVDMLWFSSVDEALAFVRDDGEARRLLAREIRIV
jgi:uncharacterized protein (TIGR02118 family)